MPEPVTLAVAAAAAALGNTHVQNAAMNIGCGVITNWLSPGQKKLTDTVVGWLGTGNAPENHDVLKITHAAYIAAMTSMATAAEAIAFDDEEAASATALAALVKESRFADFRWEGEHLPLEACQARIEHLFAGRHSADRTDEGWRSYNGLIVADLALWGIDLPPRLTTLFVDGHDSHAPWHILFRHHFAEQLKADEKKPEGERAFRILTFERLNELTVNGALLVDGITELKSALADVKDDTAAIRADTAETKALLQQLFAATQADARQRGVTDAALLALASRIAENVSDPTQALAELGRAIDDLIRLRDDAARGTNLGDLVDEVLRHMAAANAEGRIDDAAKTGERAYADWKDQQAAAQQAGLRLIEANIEQHRLRFDAEQMTHWICERLKLMNDSPPSARMLRIEQDTWYESGRNKGLRLDLDVSILLAEHSVDAATDSKERADGLNDLAIALSDQGERIGGEAGLALLARAVTAYEVAQQVYTRDVAPFDWAMTQNNLGTALQVQAQRSSDENALVLLTRSVEVLEAALEVFTKESEPNRWAMTQNNLGIALKLLGQRVDVEHSKDLLASSIKAYEAALEIRTRDEFPIDWAATQSNLGNALVAQGLRDNLGGGVELLNNAVAAYRRALEFCTRDAAPAQWAMSQENIAITLLMLARMTKALESRRHSKAAKEACLAALSVYSPEHLPFHHEKASRLLAAIDARLPEL